MGWFVFKTFLAAKSGGPNYVTFWIMGSLRNYWSHYVPIYNQWMTLLVVLLVQEKHDCFWRHVLNITKSHYSYISRAIYLYQEYKLSDKLILVRTKRQIHRIKMHHIIKIDKFKKYRWKSSAWAFIMLGTSSKSLLSQCKLTLSLFNGMNNGTYAYVSRSKCIDVTKTG